MRVDMKKLSLIKAQSGFSLVELAIIMIIMGLLTAPFLQQYNVYREQQKRDETSLSFSQSHEGLSNFYSTMIDTDGDTVPDTYNKYYPCPSNPSIAFGQPGHGVSVANCWTAVPEGTCSGGICHRNGAMIGGIPYVTLSLPYTETIDGYKNPIKYIVSDTLVNPATASDDTREGSITWEDDTGAPTRTVNTGALYGFISPGANRKGAYDLYGNLTPCASGTDDAQNCGNSGTFLRKRMTLASGEAYFDDIVEFVTSGPTSLWQLSEENPGGIYNTNPGPVGIGTNSPNSGTNNEIKLHVAGDVQAQNVRAAQYCDQAGNCMPTSIIAGAGVTCADRGQYLVGIANREPICAPVAIQNVRPRICNTDEFVSGIVGGEIVCTPIPE